MSDGTLFDYAESRAARDAGIRRAADHAEESSRGWNDRAYEMLRRYARHNSRFISENCTSWAADRGFVTVSPRAWGHVFRRAAKDGIIVRIGSGTSLRRHCSPTPLWSSAIYKDCAS